MMLPVEMLPALFAKGPPTRDTNSLDNERITQGAREDILHNLVALPFCCGGELEGYEIIDRRSPNPFLNTSTITFKINVDVRCQMLEGL